MTNKESIWLSNGFLTSVIIVALLLILAVAWQILAGKTTTVADCGSPNLEYPEREEPAKKCINERFQQCLPTRYTPSVDLAALSVGTVTYQYEIIGPSEHGCNVKSQFIKNPNAAWLGKVMQCDYDNKLDFETAVNKATTNGFNSCQGPLKDVLTSPPSCKSLDPSVTVSC
ncbi:MAG: hypothetical protein WAP74_00845 [Patescibacteria group bacterium]